MVVGAGGITGEYFDQTFDTNVKGALFTVQKALPLTPNGASVINDLLHGKRHGHTCLRRLLGFGGRDTLFARSWTTDLKERRIRVNVISPGPVEIPGVTGLARTEIDGRAIRGPERGYAGIRRMR